MTDRVYFLILELFNEANDIFWELPADTISEFYAKMQARAIG